MPINVYTGLMRSGKSYEVVAEVICPAILFGRNVVTNVDGISNDLVREYVSKKHGVPIEQLGNIIHVTNADVFKENFFPYYDDTKNSHIDTVVQPGDLVCIDEAWRFWPDTGTKIHKNHKSFFLEHGHFTNTETGVACDLVLMVQDMGTINRFIRNVVAFNFRTHKKVSLGLGKVYSVNMWEGHKQIKSTLIGNWVRKYSKEIFPLYSSFKGGADGKTINVDSRQNIFSNRWLLIKLVLCVGLAIFSSYTVWNFFHATGANAKNPAGTNSTSNGLASSAGANGSVGAIRPSTPPFSDSWRITGSYSAKGLVYIVLTNATGQVRVESPSVFKNSGYAQIGEIDGSLTTVWSGTAFVAHGNASSPVQQQASPAGLASTQTSSR